MNIMVFNENVWSNHIASGNTLSNLFEGDIFVNDNFYNIYMRNAVPNNRVCKNYYKMSLIDMLKYYFHNEKIGTEFLLNSNNMMENSIINPEKERKYIDIIHKYSMNFIYNIANRVYRRKKWLNNNFTNYIQKSEPEIFFSYLTNVAILKPILEYVKENTNAKIVLFAVDDIYSLYNKKHKSERNKLEMEFKECVMMADKIYAISNEMCEEYTRIFNKRVDILYKGCSFDYPVKKNVNDIVKFVYAGNLFYGRDEILMKVGQAIDCNNRKNKQKALLEIYTGATLTDKLKKELNIKNASIVMGKRDYEEIKKIMNNAEYNLHVESFEKDKIDYVKYSFSTKIIDCLQAGSAILGIGPSDISSIKYLKKIPGSDVIEDIENIENVIEEIITNKPKIVEKSETIREYAMQKHSINKNQELLRKQFIDLIKCKNIF